VHPLTIGDLLAGTLAELPDVSRGTYLLSEGYFLDTLRAAAAAAGVATVTEPLGAHAAIAELIVHATTRPRPVDNRSVVAAVSDSTRKGRR